MSWSRMRFRGQQVWIKVDAQGRPALDSEGRAEMKYRPEDSKSYRPSLSNLAPDGGPQEVRDQPDGGAGAAPRPARARRTAAPPKRPGPAGPDTIHVWTDGACTGNPGPMGIGVVVLSEGGRQELGEYLGVGTNNIAELTAIERGLELAAQLDPTRARPVRVYTDSAYSIGVVSQGWKAKANQQLVARLREQLRGFADPTFVKVAGHAGIPENERCDQLARRAIETRGRT
jgi:ribonuclease HI